jgi:hypothetical protein
MRPNAIRSDWPPIDLDGAITVVHPFARDDRETPAVPAAAKRFRDRRTR